MTTALERAVDALSDPNVGLPDALRSLLVVSRRIEATELTNWLRAELDGYGEAVAVPRYRQGGSLPFDLQFEGPFGTSMKHSLSQLELPEVLRVGAEARGFREPIAELVELSAGDTDPIRSLPVQWVVLYREFAEKRQVPTYEMMQLNRAAVKIPRTHLKGILDRVKTTALDLALSLEDISTEAGTSGGPTVADEPRLAKEVTIHLTQLLGDRATVTFGDNATVASGAGAVAVRLAAGDVAGLLNKAQALLAEQGVTELKKALDADGGKPGRETGAFLSRLKHGAVALASGMTINGAYDGLVALLGQVFGG